MARKRRRPGFATNCVHAGEEGVSGLKPASTPVYQTSTFFFHDIDTAADVAEGKSDGFLYTRVGNPTVRAFEDKMAVLEEGESAVAFSSGMAAVSSVFLERLKPGDEIVSSGSIYGGTRNFYNHVLNRLDCQVRYFEPGSSGKELASLITSKTKLIFFETPSNPELSIVAIDEVAEVARRHRIFSVVDNTFATPYLQKPLSFGIDCVLHSATKYIGGHGDAIGGVVVGSRPFVGRLRDRMLLNLGGCLSPFNAWLFLRGLKTLPVRMDRHCRTAAEIANFLCGQAPVETVLFPGLGSHPGHTLAAAQMKNFGGMVSFRLRSRGACRKFIKRLRLCRIAVSLGDAATLVLHPVSLFHRELSDDACRRVGADPLLIRLSTGLEDADDIIEDIKTALKAV